MVTEIEREYLHKLLDMILDGEQKCGVWQYCEMMPKKIIKHTFIMYVKKEKEEEL